LSRQGKAAGEPVTARNDPGVAHQDRYRESRGGREKPNGGPAGVQHDERTEQDWPRDSAKNEECGIKGILRALTRADCPILSGRLSAFQRVKWPNLGNQRSLRFHQRWSVAKRRHPTISKSSAPIGLAKLPQLPVFRQ